VMSQFGPVALLTSDGVRFAFSDLSASRFVEGPACPANVARFVGLQVSAAAVLSAVLGEAALASAGLQRPSCVADVGYRFVQPTSDGGEQSFDFAPVSLDAKGAGGAALDLVRVTLRDADGAEISSVAYSEHALDAASGVRLARRVHLRDLRRESDTVLRFKRLQVNAEVDPEAFVHRAGAGMERAQLGCE